MIYCSTGGRFFCVLSKYIDLINSNNIYVSSKEWYLEGNQYMSYRSSLMDFDRKRLQICLEYR